MRKNDESDDRAVDRLLRSAFPHDANPSPNCLDAETLAAWADGALNARELAAAQTHAADCARCQAMLATMARTAPATASGATARTWMPSLSWLVPLTAAASAVALWLLVAPPPSPVVTSVPTSDLRPLEAAPARQDAKAEATRAAEPQDAIAAQTPNAANKTPVREQQAREQQAPAEPTGVEADKKSLAARDQELADAAARTDNARLEKAQVTQNSAAASAAAPAAAPAPAPAAPAARTFAFGAPETVIVSSNPGSRWRLLPSGDVQRSADGGATWQTQTTGATEALTAGASPSPSVCWLVGPKGIVLLSTDGRTWKRLAFPESVSLIKILPTDDQTATVTTADGRAFVTEDGGRTWTRSPRP